MSAPDGADGGDGAGGGGTGGDGLGGDWGAAVPARKFVRVDAQTVVDHAADLTVLISEAIAKWANEYVGKGGETVTGVYAVAVAATATLQKAITRAEGYLAQQDEPEAWLSAMASAVLEIMVPVPSEGGRKVLVAPVPRGGDA